MLTKPLSVFSKLSRVLLPALAFATSLSISRAADQTVSGNLTVTGTADVNGNIFTVGTQSGSPAFSLTYANADTDTLTFYANRSPASFLWAHSSAIAGMRLTATHDLVLYKTDGTTVGLALTPATNAISLGATTLYRDSASGALRTNGALIADGSITVPSVVSTNGTITGGSSGLTLNAGGANGNITLSPSGTGVTVLNGNVGIGTSIPVGRLDVVTLGGSNSKGVVGERFGTQGAGGAIFAAHYLGNNGTAPTAGDLANSFSFYTGGANGAIFTNPSFSIRHTIGFVGAGLSVVDTSFMLNNTASGTPYPAMTMLGQSGNIGVGTTSPTTRLSVKGIDTSSSNRSFEVTDSTDKSLWAIRNDGSLTSSGAGRILFDLSGGTSPTPLLRVFGKPYATTQKVFSFADDASRTINANFNTDGSGQTSLRFDDGTNEFFRLQAILGHPAGNTVNYVTINPTINPSSSSNQSAALQINPSINQTGTANGTTYGIRIAPNLTSAADFRSLQIDTNQQYAVYQSNAVAKNYFAGNLGIGTPSPTAKLDVSGSAKMTGTITAVGGGRFDGPVRLAPQGDLPMGSFTSEP